MPTHVFIVCSPLQLRIASAIKNHYRDGCYHVIYLKTNKNIMAGVVKELKNNFNSYIIAKMDYSFINLIRINNFIKKINNGYINLYLANAGELPVHYIVSIIQKHKTIIKTFDDGIMNINSIVDIKKIDSRIKEKRKFRYKIARLLFKNSYNTQKIINESTLHFTILKKNKNKNVFSEIIKLQLFTDDQITESRKKINCENLINIFVGSRFKDILRDKNNDSLNLLMEKISNLNNFFPEIIYLRHPRELTKNALGMTEINFDSISEDYIIQLAKQNKKLNIIGFASTCQLNVIDFDNISITLLKTQLIREDIINSFPLFNGENVSIYDIDQKGVQ